MRSSFDKLISWTGIVVAVVLLFAGGLLVWASSFATQNVHDQLAAQQTSLASLQAQYATLETNYNTLNAQYSTRTAEVASLRTALDAALADAASLRTALSASQADAATLRTALDTARAEVTRLTSEAKARAIADRKTGIGCDQLIVLEPSPKADVTMRIWNNEGGEVESCGNATRCIADILFDEKKAARATIDTKGGASIASRLGVSRNTLREAIAALHASSLVASTTQLGDAVHLVGDQAGQVDVGDAGGRGDLPGELAPGTADAVHLAVLP